jgi:apurinic endonuclease APN1
VCMDTCHLYASGYDLTSPSSVEDTLSKFDDTVGLQSLKLIHLNDSKGGLGCHLDRHENIGKGHIGSAGFKAFLHNDKVRHLPMILETPIAEDGDWGKDLAVVRRLFR